MLIFLAAYAAANEHRIFERLALDFLAAYAAANMVHAVPVDAIVFLAAYAAANARVVEAKLVGNFLAAYAAANEAEELNLSFCWRLIPAFAGNTCALAQRFRARAVNPRIRGEHMAKAVLTRHIDG